MADWIAENVTELSTSELKDAVSVGIAQTSGKCDSKITEGNMSYFTAIWTFLF